MGKENIGKLISKIPWKEIMKLGPFIIKGTKDLIESLKKKPSNKNEKNVDQKISELEEVDNQQLELINQLAEQSTLLSKSLKIVSTRVNLVFWILIATLLISIICSIKVFIL